MDTRKQDYEFNDPEHLTLQEPPIGYDTLSYDDLPEHVKESIRIGLEQSERGEVIPYEEVMKKYERYLKK